MRWRNTSAQDVTSRMLVCITSFMSGDNECEENKTRNSQFCIAKGEIQIFQCLLCICLWYQVSEWALGQKIPENTLYFWAWSYLRNFSNLVFQNPRLNKHKYPPHIQKPTLSVRILPPNNFKLFSVLWLDFLIENSTKRHFCIFKWANV